MDEFTRVFIDYLCEEIFRWVWEHLKFENRPTQSEGPSGEVVLHFSTEGWFPLERYREMKNFVDMQVLANILTRGDFIIDGANAKERNRAREHIVREVLGEERYAEYLSLGESDKPEVRSCLMMLFASYKAGFSPESLKTFESLLFRHIRRFMILTPPGGVLNDRVLVGDVHFAYDEDSGLSMIDPEVHFAKALELIFSRK
jgi:hypothetical protein